MADPKRKRPNILFISSDQQHHRLLGCQNAEVRTPHLDQLAASGTLFERAYCPNPTCTPTRASIITGLMPSQHGAYSLGTKLSEKVPTLGDALHELGYATDLIGKAHFQPLREREGYPSLEAYPKLQDLDFWRHFDEPFYGFRHVELARNHTDEAHVGQHYAIWLEEKVGKDWRKYFQPPTGSTEAQLHEWNIPPDLHYNTWIAERTEARLEAHASTDEPFFMWASFFDPHPSYLVPEPYASMYDPATVTVPGVVPGEHDANPPHFQKTQEQNPDFSSELADPHGNAIHGGHSHLQEREDLAKDIAVYYGMMTFLDESIGRILAKLQALGLEEDTLVVFTSDHGHLFGQHGMIAKGPFHYEDLLRVPLIVRWPGKVAAGKRDHSLQSLVDLAPTFLAAAEHPFNPAMSGINQLDAWCGEADAVRDHVIVENRHQPTTLHLHTLVTKRYKLSVYRNAPYGELFDLEADPGELKNLWDDPGHMEIRSALMHKLVQGHLQQEPLFMPRISPA